MKREAEMDETLEQFKQRAKQGMEQALKEGNEDAITEANYKWRIVTRNMN